MAIIYLHHKLEQIPDLIFNELRKGALKKKHPFKKVVLTTVSNVIPKARWVVFRKLTSEGKIHIYTDGRSDKVKELKNNSNCSLLFYNNRQGLQIQFNCKAILHQKNELSNKYWNGVLGTSSENYTTLFPPGSTINNIEDGHEIINDIEDNHFALIEIDPLRMEVLQLSRVGHIRASFEKVLNEWKGTFLVP